MPNVIEEKSGCAMWIDFSDEPGRRTVNSDTFVVQTKWVSFFNLPLTIFSSNFFLIFLALISAFVTTLSALPSWYFDLLVHWVGNS